MSVPHLDSRWINGKRSLLFGPYAGFSTKFLKAGSFFDLPRSVKLNNFLPMLSVGVKNSDLIKYLLGQILQTDKDRLSALKDLHPYANPQDWSLSVAGQRVQIIKQTKDGAVLKMGTEIVSSSDGSLVALLGASPGASTAVEIMLKVLERSWTERMNTNKWKNKLKELFPSLCNEDNIDNDLIIKMNKRNNDLLGFG